MSAQEAAWYLLQLGTSEKGRDVNYVNTMWTEERVRVRETNAIPAARAGCLKL